jgi:DNA-binding PadR family transcriptional regulator
MKLTSVEFHVMLALFGGASHGYAIMGEVKELTSGRLRIGPGTLYAAIKRLVDARLIEECEADTERQRCYRLTRKGREIGAEEAVRLADLVRAARKRGLLPSAS